MGLSCQKMFYRLLLFPFFVLCLSERCCLPAAVVGGICGVFWEDHWCAVNGASSVSQLLADLSKCHRHRELICRWSGPYGTLTMMVFSGLYLFNCLFNGCWVWKNFWKLTYTHQICDLKISTLKIFQLWCFQFQPSVVVQQGLLIQKF